MAYPGILFWGGGGVGSPLVRGSGGNCNLVQEISYAAYTLYSYSQHGSIYSGLYSCSLGYVCEFLLFLHWLPLNLVILLRMYFPRNWEFSSALSKLQNFGRGLNPPPQYATACCTVHYNLINIFLLWCCLI
jgi:hypothetical protein